MAVVVFILKRTSCEKSGRPHDQKICPCCIVRRRHRMFRPVDSARDAKKVASPMFDRWRGVSDGPRTPITPKWVAGIRALAR